MKKVKILSTKKLSLTEKSIFSSKNIDLTEVDFISIQSLDFEINSFGDILLFTSKNAVTSLLKNKDYNVLKKINCICVGQKTHELLEQNGFNVLDFAHYAEDLSQIIEAKYKSNSFTFFSGNLRRDILPDFFRANNIAFQEIQVYANQLVPQKIQENFDAILFYSQSGIKSFLQENKIENQVCFCIGTTTTDALNGITTNIVLAKLPTIESVLEAVIDFYR